MVAEAIGDAVRGKAVVAELGGGPSGPDFLIKGVGTALWLEGGTMPLGVIGAVAGFKVGVAAGAGIGVLLGRMEAGMGWVT
jgi:hypothetical protein